MDTKLFFEHSVYSTDVAVITDSFHKLFARLSYSSAYNLTSKEGECFYHLWKSLLECLAKRLLCGNEFSHLEKGPVPDFGPYVCFDEFPPTTRISPANVALHVHSNDCDLDISASSPNRGFQLLCSVSVCTRDIGIPCPARCYVWRMPQIDSVMLSRVSVRVSLLRKATLALGIVHPSEVAPH